MTQTPTTQNASVLTRRRADALADRLEQGAKALTDFAASLTDAQWKTRCMPDGRTVGVIVHHVGFVYPIEIDISRPLAKGVLDGNLLATFVDLPIARQNEVTRQIGTDRATVLKDWVALSGAW